MSYRIAEPLGSYFVGDVPDDVKVAIVTPDGDEVDLSLVGSVTAAVDGIPVTATTGSVWVDGEPQWVVTVKFPAETLFTAEGLYALSLTLTTVAGTVTVAPAMFTVEVNDGWHTVGSVRSEWPDAPDESALLYTLLSVARFQVQEFAPAVAGRPPLRYRMAQAMQARNLWISTRADPAGTLGDGEFTIRPFPMDNVVKNIIRPKRAIPAVA